MAETLLREINPGIVAGIGLWPGEPVIRIERVGINVADFEIPDNLGYVAADEPVLGSGAAARLATVPVRAMEEALLDAGIPRANLQHGRVVFLQRLPLHFPVSRRGDAGAGRLRLHSCSLPSEPGSRPPSPIQGRRRS